MSELRELYQEVILDHNKQPRNFKAIEPADRKADGYNPLCGDHWKVSLKLNGDTVEDIGFVGTGCAISKASASMMTTAVKGKTKVEAESLFQKFPDMITGIPHQDVDPALGKLAVFSGVCEFPARVKCAGLPWHTLRSALEGKSDTVSTEEGEK